MANNVQAVSIEKVLKHYNLLLSFEPLPNGFIGKCPIHNGDNPSHFIVDTSDNSWVCHGSCSKRGDVVDFVMQKENVNRKRAMARLREWFP